jgi:hypothetical protein
MNGSQSKQVRKAIKEAVDARCNEIETYVKDYLAKNDKREKAIRSFLMQDVKFKIQNDLFNATCTVDAIVEVLAESGITIPDFAAKVDAKKVEVARRKNAEADKRMEEEMKARAEAAKQPESQPEAPPAQAAEQQPADQAS